MRFKDYDYFYEYMVLEISDIYIIYLNSKDYSLYMRGMLSKGSFGCVRSLDHCLKNYAAQVRFLSYVWH